VWLHATGAVKVWRSEIEWTSTPAEAIDKAINQTVLVAEHTYVPAWDCCHFAVPVLLFRSAHGRRPVVVSWAWRQPPDAGDPRYEYR
jgi:hypothetical protein